MPRLNLSLRAGAWLAAVWLGIPAMAEEGRVDQIERAAIEAGETEAELQTIHVPAGGGEAAAWAANVTFERGLSRSLSLGLEIETEAGDGAGLDVDSVGLQAKWVANPAEATRFGVQAGLYRADDGNFGSETFLIAETRAGGLDLVGNLVIGTEPGKWSEASATYGLRADRAAGGRLLAGLEAGGGISGEGAGAHWLGPVLSFLPEEETGLPAVELSLFLPLTEDTPDVQFRLELDRAF